MYYPVKSIKLKGAAFDQEVTFDLFPTLGDRITLIFGRNGSGKSTIARAFKKAFYEESGPVESAELINHENGIIDSAKMESCLHVFDEEYIRNHVVIEKDGLSTIVILGNQVDLDREISKTQRILDIKREELESQQKKYDEFNDLSNIISPGYFLTALKNDLSGDSHWAGRERLINDTRRNASVTDGKWDEIAQVKPDKPQKDLVKEFDLTLNALRKARTGNGKILADIPDTDGMSFDSEHVKKLLLKKIEKPVLNEREKYLFSLVQKNMSAKVDEMRETFSQENLDFCPLCLQPVSENYKLNLISDIETVLSKEVDIHKTELSKYKMETFQFDDAPFTVLSGNNINVIKKLISDLNKEIERLNDAIDKKCKNPYEPIILTHIKINEILQKLSEELKDLSKLREEYNARLSDPEVLKTELKNLNKEIAFYEIQEDYKNYQKQKKARDEAETALEDIQKDVAAVQNEINNLNNKKKSVKIAVELMNRNLNFIFFSKDRLNIKVEDGIYKLVSRGRDLKPSNISTGERNIIALSYFFVDMLQNTSQQDGYNHPMCVVIDDPISSFDFENKVGVFSFLRMIIEKLMQENNKTQVLLMSHDRSAIYNLETSIKNSIKHINNCNFNQFELASQKLMPLNDRSFNEYSIMMEKIYEYALNGCASSDLTIGNITRRMFEAFSTFTYQIGMEGITQNEEIMNKLPDDTYRDYFKNLVYRLVLNGESHTKERIKLGMDCDFLHDYSPNEIQKIAQGIICFVYLLDPLHVIVHLKNIADSDVEGNIKTWCDSIKAQYQIVD